MKKIVFSLLLLLTVQAALAQEVLPQSPGWFNRVGRASLGFHGAANLWINNFDKRQALRRRRCLHALSLHTRLLVWCDGWL